MVSEFIKQYRSAFSTTDAVRNSGMTVPEDVVCCCDLAYGEDPVYQKLDVYRPCSAGDSVLPVIFSVHGGGWVYGDKEIYKFYCMSLAQQGFAVVNYSYRLAPEAKFPAALEDTNTVVEWALKNREAYGFDRRRLFAVGDSAGAQILSLYAAMCADPALAEQCGIKPVKKKPFRAVALNCGAYRIADEPSLRQLMREYFIGGGTEEELRLNHVIDHVTAEFPPAFVMTALGDFKHLDAIPMAQALANSGVPFVLRQYGTPESPLYHVFHLDVQDEDANRCNEQECAFFREYC